MSNEKAGSVTTEPGMRQPDALATPGLLTHEQMVRELEQLRDRIPADLDRHVQVAEVPRDVLVGCSAAVNTALWLLDRLELPGDH